MTDHLRRATTRRSFRSDTGGGTETTGGFAKR